MQVSSFPRKCLLTCYFIFKFVNSGTTVHKWQRKIFVCSNCALRDQTIYALPSSSITSFQFYHFMCYNLKPLITTISEQWQKGKSLIWNELLVKNLKPIYYQFGFTVSPAIQNPESLADFGYIFKCIFSKHILQLTYATVFNCYSIRNPEMTVMYTQQENMSF